MSTPALLHAVTVTSSSAFPRVATLAVPVKKQDDELQVVWGEVYAPGSLPDTDGDFMTAETVREMAWAFLQKKATDQIDVQHNRLPSGAYVVESFVARDDDPLFIPGAWVLGVKIPDPALWAMIKSGELNGFSIDGLGCREPARVEIELPDVLGGETDRVQGHEHGFEVSFAPDGTFQGGQTTPGADGHVHPIVRGTVTEVACFQGAGGPGGDHAHRFSFVEGVLHAQAAA